MFIVFWLDSDRPSGLFFLCSLYFFPYSRLSSCRLRLSCILFQSCCSHARVLGKILLHEFPISYSHTESYLLFSRNDLIEMVEESPAKNDNNNNMNVQRRTCRQLFSLRFQFNNCYVTFLINTLIWFSKGAKFFITRVHAAVACLS